MIQELIVQELKEIKLGQKNIQTEIKRLDEKIALNSARLDNKMDTGFARLDDKIDSFRNEMRSETKRIDEKIDIALQIRERLASLEAKVANLSR